MDCPARQTLSAAAIGAMVTVALASRCSGGASSGLSIVPGRQANVKDSATRPPESSDKLTSGRSLRERIKEALLAILEDVDAPAAAKVDACRELEKYCTSDDPGAIAVASPAAEMSIEDIDAAIARHQAKSVTD